MLNRIIRCSLIAGFAWLAAIHTSSAQIIPNPNTSPAPTLAPVTPPPINPATTSIVELDALLPVVINYGQGKEVRANIYRGVLEPVGFLPSQAATITVTFPSTWAGVRVTLGCLDGGQVGAAAPPSEAIVPYQVTRIPVGGAFQFNFQAGRLRGLYRVVMSVGNAEYLLRFYAGTPAPGPSLPPLPGSTVPPDGAQH